MKVTITHHAKRRIRQRLGIPYKGALKHARIAFFKSEIVQPLQNNTRMLIVYNGHEYVFGLDKDYGCPRLITVIHEKN